MAKFIYRMQNILNLKERLETQARSEYAEMTARVRQEEAVEEELKARLYNYQEYAKQCANDRLNLIEMRRTDEAVKIIRDQIEQQKIRIRIAKKNEDIAREKLAEAIQDRKVQEILKEKAFEEFKQELNAQESKEIDEVVSFNYNNREEDN